MTRSLYLSALLNLSKIHDALTISLCTIQLLKDPWRAHYISALLNLSKPSYRWRAHYISLHYSRLWNYQIHDAEWFCTMDLASGYWQIKMKEEDKPKTAFVTRKGLFQFKVMPFGLCNAPATFQRLMDRVLVGLQWEQCLVYLDDIVVFGKTFEQTLARLRLVMERLKAAGLKLKASKCKWFQKSVQYLGHIVSAEGIKCDPEKIETVKDWPIPKSVAQVRSFLGLASYYRKFIDNFAEIAHPLTSLTRKRAKFCWSTACQQSFETLKECSISAPVLAYPLRDAGEFVLDTDASNHGMGAVLSQVQNGQEKVIAYASRTLNGSQRNYCTTKKELLADIRTAFSALSVWTPFYHKNWSCLFEMVKEF